MSAQLLHDNPRDGVMPDSSLPRCAQTESGLECIGDGHGGCGWRGCELAAPPQACVYTVTPDGCVTGYKLDPESEDTVCVCPRCGGECAHTPLNEVVFPEVVEDQNFVCECRQKSS